jgi:hypothetical protein
MVTAPADLGASVVATTDRQKTPMRNGTDGPTVSLETPITINGCHSLEPIGNELPGRPLKQLADAGKRHVRLCGGR